MSGGFRGLPKCKLGPFLVALLLLCTQNVRAATIYLKSKAQPIYGTILKKTPSNLTIRTSEGGSGATKDVVYATSEIAELFEPVVATRLEKLEPSNPAAYREYAEELAEHRKDPEAMAMAIELYLRSAQLEKGDGRNSALRGLVAAARNSAERRRFAAAALSLSPNLPFALLAAGGNGGKTESAPDAAAGTAAPSRERLLQFMQAVRVGRAPGNSPQGQTVLEHFPSYLLTEKLTLEQLATASKKGTRPTGDILREVLLLEARLEQEEGLVPRTPQAGDLLGFSPGSWANTGIQKQRFQPLPTKLQDLTTSDLSATIYRQGKWVRP